MPWSLYLPRLRIQNPEPMVKRESVMFFLSSYFSGCSKFPVRSMYQFLIMKLYIVSLLLCKEYFGILEITLHSEAFSISPQEGSIGITNSKNAFQVFGLKWNSAVNCWVVHFDVFLAHKKLFIKLFICMIKQLCSHCNNWYIGENTSL